MTILVRVDKEKESCRKKFYPVRERIYHHEQEVAQMEMMNMLLEIGGKVTLLKSDKNLAELCSSILWMIELSSDD